MSNYGAFIMSNFNQHRLALSIVIGLFCIGCGRQDTRPVAKPVDPQQSSRPVAQLAEAPETPPAQEATADSTLSSMAQTLSQAYESAKSKGQTATTSARDWILNDINSTNRWEYRVVPISDMEPTQLESRLNELGRDGWQCFHVQANGPMATFFMQRHPSSISRNIPMSDLLKVLPYLGLGKDNQ